MSRVPKKHTAALPIVNLLDCCHLSVAYFNIHKASFITSIIVALASILLTGCAGNISERAQDLELGMPKASAIKIIGHRRTIVAARRESSGGSVEVLRFKDKKGTEIMTYFRDGKLVQWGDASVLQGIPQ
jgi:hypothetical protein